MVVYEKKSGKLRIRIDPRDLDTVMEREPYQLLTQQEITSRLGGARSFSKLDATSGYWQIPLEEESSYLTTFNSPMHARQPLLTCDVTLNPRGCGGRWWSCDFCAPFS